VHRGALLERDELEQPDRLARIVVDADVPAQYLGGVVAAPSFSISSADLGGSLSIQPRDPETSVLLTFNVEPLGNGCVGTVRLDTMMSMPGGAFGVSGNFGSWSDTACSVGQESVAIDVPGQNGTPSLSTMITTAWSKAAIWRAPAPAPAAHE
jgi:hypothetical protein